MKIIGLDVGEKRIGVAKADTDTRIAVPVGFVNVDGLEWQEIAEVAKLNNTNYFVVGLPRSNEGNETQQSLYVRNFAKILLEKIPGAKLRFQDESLTSVVAEERLKSRGKKYEKGDIDAEAASIILQDFLESFNTNSMAQLETPRVEDPSGELDIVKNLARKQTDKVLLNTKKVKHKMSTSTKWVSGIMILVIIGLIAAGVVLLIREQRHQEYLAWLAEQEAQMEPEVFNFMIRPGETIFEVKDSLMEVGYSGTEADEALRANYDFSFLKGRPEGATLEGYLFGESRSRMVRLANPVRRGTVQPALKKPKSLQTSSSSFVSSF